MRHRSLTQTLDESHLIFRTERFPKRDCLRVVPESPTPADAVSLAAPDRETVSSDISLLPANAKPAYPPAAKVPTQVGPKGIRFDFNDGCRVTLPKASHPWRVRITDLDTGNVLYETEIKAGRVNSSKRYYVRFRVEVWADGDSLMVQDYSATDRDVLIQFPVGTLGDTLGWFPYAVKFKERHRCRLTCAMSEKLIPLFRESYPDITFATHVEVKPEHFYATYSIGLFFDDKDCVHQPCDFRHVGLHRTAGYILGVDPTEVPAKIAILDDSRAHCLSLTSALRRRARRRPSTGTTQMAGAKS